MSSDMPQREEPQPINPYQSSAVPETVGAAAAGNAPLQIQVQRNYRIHMDWATRRRFLRLAVPMRIGAVACALLMVYFLYGSATFLWASWRLGDPAFFEFHWILRIAYSAARTVVFLFVCWFVWKLADAVVATAGGTSSSMEEWSRIHQRVVWAMIVALVLNVVFLGGSWFAIQIWSGSNFGL